MKTHLSALALSVLLAAAPSFAATAKLPAQWNQIAGIFDRTLAEDQIVGGSIGYVENGRMLDRRDYGFADKVKGIKVDGDTIFHWASITKTLNAISVMQMRDQGKLSLNDSLARYVPEIRHIHNPYGAIEIVTIAMALNHTAGFQASTWPYKSGERWEPFEPTKWEQLVAMMPYQKLEHQPGYEYSYSNPSWIYLAHMVEQMSGDPWQYYIDKNIFLPLGMTRSYFGYAPHSLREHRSRRYYVHKDESGKVITDDSDQFNPGITIPNGGWNSPLEDMAKYFGFLTHAARGDAQLQGRYDSVLAQSSLREMFQPQHPTSDKPGAEQIGMAFFITDIGKSRIVGHTGGQGGYVSFMYFNPANGRAVVAAFNTANGARPETERGSFSILRDATMKLLQ